MSYIAGRSEPKPSAIFSIASASGVSPAWLLTGEQSSHQHEAITYIPRYDVQASAGGGSVAEQERLAGHIALPTAWLRRLGGPLNTLSAIEARGESMEPDLRDGDVLLVDTSRRRVDRDGLYVLRYGDTLRVKALQQRADGGILIRSAAAHEADEIVPRERLGDLTVIGRVRWHGRSL